MFKFHLSMVTGLMLISGVGQADVFNCSTQCDDVAPKYDTVYHFQSSSEQTTSRLQLKCGNAQYNLLIMTRPPDESHSVRTTLTAQDSRTNRVLASISLPGLANDQNANYLLRWQDKDSNNTQTHRLFCSWNGR